MQDTIVDKLLPRGLSALAETPGSQIEMLKQAERLGVEESVERWSEARKLRTRLVHEYIEDGGAFAEGLVLTGGYSTMGVDTFNRLRGFAASRMEMDETSLSAPMHGKVR